MTNPDILRGVDVRPRIADTETVDRLIPVREAFELVGMRPTRGYSEIACGRLKILKNGRRTFVRASEIKRYIAALEGTPRKAA